MQSQLVDLYRAGIRSATDMMKLSLEQTERLQQQQFQLIRSALDESMRSGSQAGDAKSLDDMVALQSRIAGAQFERMTEFWANWWRAAGDAQKSMIEQMQSQMGQARERVREGAAVQESKAQRKSA
jgi:phasin family protein